MSDRISALVTCCMVRPPIGCRRSVVDSYTPHVKHSQAIMHKGEIGNCSYSEDLQVLTATFDNSANSAGPPSKKSEKLHAAHGVTVHMFTFQLLPDVIPKIDANPMTCRRGRPMNACTINQYKLYNTIGSQQYIRLFTVFCIII